MEKPKRNGERYGGVGGKPNVLYQAGPNLSAIARKLGFPHNPLGKKGNVLFYNVIAHAGCGKGDRCLFPHARRIRHEGLHWTAQYDIAMRGGLSTGKRIDPGSVEGYFKSLRSQHGAEMKKSIDESRGNVGRMCAWFSGYVGNPPGLVGPIHLSATSSTPRVGRAKEEGDRRLE